MSANQDNATVRQKFNQIVRRCTRIDNSTERQDSRSFQSDVLDTLKQLNALQFIVRSLSLFGKNERLSEVNTSYLPFIAISYYEAALYQKLLRSSEDGDYNGSVDLSSKSNSLKKAKVKFLQYLTQVDSLGQILSSAQSKTLNSYETSYNPSNQDILEARGNPAQQRADKIASFKYEKELQSKVCLLDEFYSEVNDKADEDTDEDIFSKLDEDMVRSLYENQLKLFALHSFKSLELVALELQVMVESEAHQTSKPSMRESSGRKTQEDVFDYNPRLEADPTKRKNIKDLIDKQGKILQPFVITKDKDKLRREVFGTGQVLPSMSVEEYLDYELANGKMASSNPKDQSANDTEDETDDSDEEFRKREWDDWKDDNPKGSGNMKANLG